MIYVILAYVSYPFIYLAAKLFPPKGPESILVFQTAKIGDMICTSPIFREIKKARPNARIGVMIDPSTSDLIKYNPYVDEIFELGSKDSKGIGVKISLAVAIRSKGYTSAVILSANATNILSAFWAMLPVRVCVGPDYAGGTLRKLIALNTHIEWHAAGKMTMETFALCLRHLGIKAGRLDKEVYAPPGLDFTNYLNGASPFVGLFPCTGNPMKEWGKSNFIDLGRLILANTECSVVLLGSAKERDLIGEIDSALRAGGEGERVINLCGEFTLAELPLIIRKLSAVVGVDTGLIYMADAERVPLIDISGPSDINDQRPTGKNAVIIQNKLDCVPCSHTFKTPYKCVKGHRRCLVDVKPEDVYARLAKLLPNH